MPINDPEHELEFESSNEDAAFRHKKHKEQRSASTKESIRLRTKVKSKSPETERSPRGSREAWSAATGSAELRAQTVESVLTDKAPGSGRARAQSLLQTERGYGSTPLHGMPNFKDLGEKVKGTTAAKVESRRSSTDFVRAATRIAEGRQGDPSPMLKVSSESLKYHATGDAGDSFHNAKAVLGKNMPKEKGFKDLGEKPQALHQGSKSHLQTKFKSSIDRMIPGMVREGRAVAEGRQGDPSPMDKGSKPLKTALAREVGPGRNRQRSANQLKQLRPYIDKAAHFQSDRSAMSAAETGEAQAFVGKLKPGVETRTEAHAARNLASRADTRRRKMLTDISASNKKLDYKSDAQRSLEKIQNSAQSQSSKAGQAIQKETEISTARQIRSEHKIGAEVKESHFTPATGEGLQARMKPGVESRTQQHHLQSRERPQTKSGSPFGEGRKDLGRATMNVIRSEEGKADGGSLKKLAISRAKAGRSVAGPDPKSAPKNRSILKRGGKGGMPGGGPSDVSSDLHSNLGSLKSQTWGLNKKLEPGDL